MIFFCPSCGERVIWQSDFDGEDVGLDVESIISYYACPDCNLLIEAYYDDTCTVLKLLNEWD
jgi:predicted RNA-binding Zn-ribbon protein involved in translation (DUF1610 family)